MRPGLVIDNFAGGGGASVAMTRVFGHVDIAINHSRKALAMHARNHPMTRHMCENVWDVDPKEVCAGRPIDALWLSPDCTHFSKAKGGQPRKKEIRALADIVFKWTSLPRWQRPKAIYLENVEEWQDWGPLDDDGYPIKELEGRDFRRWLARMRSFGYRPEVQVSRACEYGVPTIRKRLMVIARLGVEYPVVWPKPTHYDPKSRSPSIRVGMAPHRTAAECIDWSVPCPSIFDRPRPLVENSLKRIARGTFRYVLDAADPFIIPVTHHGDSRVHSIHEPLRTITTTQRGELALIVPTLIQTGYGERKGQAPRSLDIRAPLGTVMATGNKHALVAAFLAQYNNHRGVEPSHGRPATAPLSTITMRGTQQQLVAAHLCHLYGSNQTASGGDLREPLRAVLSGGGRGGGHASLVAAFLMKYYGAADHGQSLRDPLHTATSIARFGLVTVLINGETYVLTDIGQRMLTPRELYRAQGFPEDYIIDLEVDGKRLTKSDQVAMCGNSVCPGWAEAHIRVNNPREPLEAAWAA